MYKILFQGGFHCAAFFCWLLSGVQGGFLVELASPHRVLVSLGAARLDKSKLRNQPAKTTTRYGLEVFHDFSFSKDFQKSFHVEFSKGVLAHDFLVKRVPVSP